MTIRTARRRRLLQAALALVLLGATACSGAPADPLADPAAASPPPPGSTTAPESPAPRTPGAPPPSTGEPSPPGAEERADRERCTDPLGCYDDPEQVGTFDAEVIPEASGLAASARNPDVLYLLDDRPGTSEVWAVRTDGTMLGALPIADMDARDGESLALGPCGAGSPEDCLYVGDIGDNARSRDDVVVHRVAEPDLSTDFPLPLAADTARLRYPHGPHDAEALLVDDDGRVHIVTKAPFDRESGTTGEARLYRADTFADGVLTDLGTVPVPEPVFPVQSMFVGNVVTGGDHRDGRVLLRTYDQVLEYIAPDGERDLATLAGWEVREVPSAIEPQSEALTWAADGCGYLTAGEVVGAIWRVRCRS